MGRERFVRRGGVAVVLGGEVINAGKGGWFGLVDGDVAGAGEVTDEAADMTVVIVGAFFNFARASRRL